MKATNKRYIFGLGLAIVALLLFSLVLHVGRRYHALTELTRLPLAQQRMAIQPSRKVFLEPEGSVRVIDLGYCKFALPPGFQIEKSTRGVEQTCVVLANEDISLVILAPFAEYSMIGVQTEIDIENSECPSFWQVMFLREKHFGALLAALGYKASTTRGWNEVYSYTADNTVGLVRIGDSFGDRLHASASISARKGNRHVGFHLEIMPNSTNNLDDILDYMLSTFEFTVDSIPEDQALATIIRGAIEPTSEHEVNAN